jgi:hypothetical protein
VMGNPPSCGSNTHLYRISFFFLASGESGASNVAVLVGTSRNWA